MFNRFPPVRDYSSLSVRDLLDARSAYHLHLAHLPNVVSTAIGKYRIHRDDWHATHSPREPRPENVEPVTSEKTLYNTVVQPWSWPCVLVFVRRWIDRVAFAQEPDQMVPRALFLPDGRVVPTCVVRVEEQDAPAASADTPSFPRGLIGGGFALTSSLQGRDRLGSVGCLVTDGHLTYALTNRHVAGEAGEEIFSVLRGRLERVGVSAGKELQKKPFGDVYPGWLSERGYSNLDIGLIRIDDLARWTTQIAGLGPICMPLDLTTDNISLDLIDQPVRAYGGASGPLTGTISALFYRYKSVGGSDYIADVLIAPQQGSITRPGDSGTIWCAEMPLERTLDSPITQSELRPLAIQWGGHVIVDSQGDRKEAHAFALGTFLSTVCRELDVDVVRGWNSGLPEYWGDVGHYTIGAKACQLFAHNDRLSQLMLANLDRISYRDEKIQPKTFKGLSTAAFVPLADVPDKVWKTGGNGARGGPEHPNHFADMDKPGPNGTLLELTAAAGGKTNPKSVTVKTFQTYYDAVKDKSRGLLPFRVWQLFDLMVAAAAKNDPAEFIAAGGVMAHYVGDACQPLHISYKFNGNPDELVAGKPRGTGVHEAYESHMLNRHGPEMLEALNRVLGLEPGKTASHGLTPFAKNGHDAAVQVVDLMRKAFQTISPDDIINTFVEAPDQLWNRHGEATVALLAEGARSLALIWESAWLQGEGKISNLGAVKPEQLSAKYLDKEWAPSKTLDHIAPLLSTSDNAAATKVQSRPGRHPRWRGAAAALAMPAQAKKSRSHAKRAAPKFSKNGQQTKSRPVR